MVSHEQVLYSHWILNSVQETGKDFLSVRARHWWMHFAQNEALHKSVRI